MNIGEGVQPQIAAMNMIKKYGLREAANWAWHYRMNNADVGSENAAIYWEAVHRWINTQQRRAPYWRRAS